MSTTNGKPREGATILRLEAHDFQGLRFARLEGLPATGLVRVTGANGAGKSSILRAIRGAMAGAAEVHERSIRDGAENGATVDVELTNGFRIRRRHTEANPKGHLVVEGADGGKHGQAKLNDILGPLSFDPQAFFSLDAKRQREILLSIGHDPELAKKLDDLRARRAKLYEERTPWISRQREARKVTKPEGARPQPVDTSAAMAELRELQARQREQQDEQRALREMQARIVAAGREIDLAAEEVGDLEDKLRRARKRLAHAQESCAELIAEQAAAEEAYHTHENVSPAIDAVTARIEQADAVQRALKPWEAWDDAQVLFSEATDRVAELTRRMNELQADEHRLIAEAGIPVRGLSFDEDGSPLLNGKPLELASGGEKIEMATDVAIAANPEVRVALVDEGNDLDLEALDRLRRRAEQHSFQVWLCRIGLEGPGEVTVAAGEARTKGADQVALEV